MPCCRCRISNAQWTAPANRCCGGKNCYLRDKRGHLISLYHPAKQEETPMSLTLHYHPLSSFCWKVLVALYENETPFTPHMVNLGDEAERAALLKLWPIGKFPVLRDDALDRTVPESSIIIEYLDTHYPGRTRFIAADEKLALQ